MRDARYIHYPAGGKYYGGLNDNLAWRPVQDALHNEDLAAVLVTPPASSYRNTGCEATPALRGDGNAFYGNPGIGTTKESCHRGLSTLNLATSFRVLSGVALNTLDKPVVAGLHASPRFRGSQSW